MWKALRGGEKRDVNLFFKKLTIWWRETCTYSQVPNGGHDTAQGSTEEGTNLSVGPGRASWKGHLN